MNPPSELDIVAPASTDSDRGLLLQSEEEAVHGQSVAWVQLDQVAQHRIHLGFSGLQQLMSGIAERIRVQLDAGDRCTPMGLDALALYLRHDDSGRDHDALATRLVRAVGSNLFDIGEHEVAATVSIAVRLSGTQGRGVEFELAEAAAEAEALSARGGNRATVTESGNRASDGNATSIAQLLRKALRDDGIRIVTQPLLATHGAERECAQLLPRLLDFNGRLVPAAQFVPIAAERGLLGHLDRWMLRHAIELLRSRPDDSRPQYFVNQSVKMLEDPSLIEWLQRELAPLPLPPRSLVLQFRVLDLKPRLRQVAEVLARLRALGLGVALSGIDETVPDVVLLKHLPCDYLRMKADFARRLLQDPSLARRFEKFTALAHQAQRQLIVPMLEDADEVARIWQMDVDLIQGNFIQTPTEVPLG
ncbi:MAG: hypothetical protein Kow0020_09980 [Wenzhouxiangellaceae bacterium]